MPHDGRRSWSTRLARDLRGRMTDEERRLDWYLSRGFPDSRFRRQMPMGPYICDFVCMSAGLIVEVDGIQHQKSTDDTRRDRYLRAAGFRVLRFANGDINLAIDGVLETIGAALRTEEC